MLSTILVRLLQVLQFLIQIRQFLLTVLGFPILLLLHIGDTGAYEPVLAVSTQYATSYPLLLLHQQNDVLSIPTYIFPTPS